MLAGRTGRPAHRPLEAPSWQVSSPAILTVTHHDGGYWFFKGDQCCKTNDAGTSFKVEPALITKSGRWPTLETV